MKPIVSDTGPLLHLREAGALNLLETAGRIVIPPAVQAELIDHDSFWEERRPVWVQVERLEPITRNGEPAGVLIGFRSAEDWADYQIENDPRFLRRIEESRRSFEAGRGVRLEDVED